MYDVGNSDHTHLNSRFRKLAKPVEVDGEAYTDHCYNCDSPRGLRYDSRCLDGCDVEVTECFACGACRYVTHKWLDHLALEQSLR